jgi:hypothetical protein
MEKKDFYKGTYGLDNYHDPERLLFNPESGILGLSEAVNVDIDDTYRAKRRQGYSLVLAGNFHSLKHFGSIILAVLNSGTSSQLVHVANDFSGTTNLLTVTDNARMSYQKVAENIYFCNGFEKGIVSTAGVYSDWTAGSYVGITRSDEYSDPPIGSILFTFGGRMYVVEGNVLWYSIPFGYSQFRQTADFLWFEDNIILTQPVEGGIWLSTEKQIFFISGREPREFELKEKANYPAIAGTGSKINGDKVLEGKLDGVHAIFSTIEGICLGSKDGEFINLTDMRLDMPTVSEGAAVVSNSRYIVTLKS